MDAASLMFDITEISCATAAEGEPPTSASGPSAQEGSDDEMAGIDPEFLAALPEELQAEVLEAQRRERRQRRAEAEHAAAQVNSCLPGLIRIALGRL